MPRFRARPVEIEAIRWTGKNQNEIQAFTRTECLEVDFLENLINFKELESKEPAKEGDWIIRGTAGELYPCKPEIFERKYEQVE